MGDKWETKRQMSGLFTADIATYTVTNTETGKKGEVTVWASDDELKDVGKAISQGKIRDINE